MKYFLLLMVLIVLNIKSIAQDQDKSKEKQKKELKSAKKAYKDSVKTSGIMHLNSLIIGRKWTLETDIVYGEHGKFFNVNPIYNFVSVQNEGGIIQLSFNNVVGWNGMGGVTVEGRISDYEVLQPKKEGGGVTLKAVITSQASSADMTLRVLNNDRAEVSIKGVWGLRLTFSGRLMHASESGVYKGTPIY